MCTCTFRLEQLHWTLQNTADECQLGTGDHCIVCVPYCIQELGQEHAEERERDEETMTDGRGNDGA